jgi:hypothetical protein
MNVSRLGALEECGRKRLNTKDEAREGELGREGKYGSYH